MEFFTARTIKFKAWDVESKLLVRLESIPCDKGQLKKKHHILLQFTGCLDEQKQELYEMDVVLKGSEKMVIQWNETHTGWCLTPMESKIVLEPLTSANAAYLKRLCSYFESVQYKNLSA